MSPGITKISSEYLNSRRPPALERSRPYLLDESISDYVEMGIAESDFLKDDEICMYYDKKTDRVLSPFLLSFDNLIRALRLQYLGGHKLRGKNRVSFCKYGANVIAFYYSKEMIPYEAKIEWTTPYSDTPAGAKMVINFEYPTFCIESSFLVSPKGGPFFESLELKEFIEKDKKNVFDRVIGELSLVRRLKNMMSKGQPEFIV